MASPGCHQLLRSSIMDGSNPTGNAAAPVVRLAPAQREAIIERLATAFANDVIDIDEYDRRVTAVYGATTLGELTALVSDLGVAPHQDGGTSVASARTGPAMRVGAFFSSVERDAFQTVPARLDVRATFGNVELDLRHSHFEDGVTVIDVRAFMGNVEIWLPPDLLVENYIESRFSSATCTSGAVHATAFMAPNRTVRITGRALFACVEVDRGSPRAVAGALPQSLAPETPRVR